MNKLDSKMDLKQTITIPWDIDLEELEVLKQHYLSKGDKSRANEAADCINMIVQEQKQSQNIVPIERRQRDRGPNKYLLRQEQTIFEDVECLAQLYNVWRDEMRELGNRFPSERIVMLKRVIQSYRHDVDLSEWSDLLDPDVYW